MSTNNIAIWKNTWLPFSETFIRDQVGSLESWSATTLGFHNSDDGIMQADCAPYPQTRWGRMERRALGVRAKQQIYLQHLGDAQVRVMHAHFGSGGIFSSPLADALNIPHITTFHGADTHRFGSRIPGTEKWYKRSLARLFISGDQFIAASQHVANELIQHGAPAEKVQVIYTGTQAVDKVSTHHRHGIAFLGRLTSIKGADHLIRAVSCFKTRKAQHIRVSVAGDGPQRKYLERLADNLGVNCDFVGRIDAAAVPAYLAEHEIFCAPSLPSVNGTREGFGMVFLEAALQELPVVSYASGGVVEAVDDGTTGLLVPESNIDALAKHLEMLIINPELALAMGIAGRARALRDFNILKQVQKLEDIYSHVAR